MSPLCEGWGPERKRHTPAWECDIKHTRKTTSTSSVTFIQYLLHACIIFTLLSLHLLFFCTKHYWAVTQMRSTRGCHSTRDLISISTFPFPRRVNRSISVWTVDGDHCNKKQPDRGCRWHCDSFTFILNSPQRGWLVGQIIVMHPGLNMLHCTYMQGDEIKKSSLVFCDFHHLSLTFQPFTLRL